MEKWYQTQSQEFQSEHVFVRQKIGYAVVLIDEIDLNLYPPIVQFLVNQLFKISSTCQFILTSHSEAVNNVIDMKLGVCREVRCVCKQLNNTVEKSLFGIRSNQHGLLLFITRLA